MASPKPGRQPPDPRMKVVGANIQAVLDGMKPHPWTQGMLAQKIGMKNRESISQYCAGEVNIPAFRLMDMATAMRVPVSRLIGDMPISDFEDDEAARHYKLMPETLKPAAKAVLRALYEQGRPALTYERDEEYYGNMAQAAFEHTDATVTDADREEADRIMREDEDEEGGFGHKRAE